MKKIMLLFICLCSYWLLSCNPPDVILDPIESTSITTSETKETTTTDDGTYNDDLPWGDLH